MPAYAYPITIKKRKLPVHFDETVDIDKSPLTLPDLAFVGNDEFYVTELDSGGYRISVIRTREETDQERDTRVAREEAYMAEYNRRHAKP